MHHVRPTDVDRQETDKLGRHRCADQSGTVTNAYVPAQFLFGGGIHSQDLLETIGVRGQDSNFTMIGDELPAELKDRFNRATVHARGMKSGDDMENFHGFVSATCAKVMRYAILAISMGAIARRINLSTSNTILKTIK